MLHSETWLWLILVWNILIIIDLFHSRYFNLSDVISMINPCTSILVAQIAILVSQHGQFCGPGIGTARWNATIINAICCTCARHDKISVWRKICGLKTKHVSLKITINDHWDWMHDFGDPLMFPFRIFGKMSIGYIHVIWYRHSCSYLGNCWILWSMHFSLISIICKRLLVQCFG